MGDEVLPIILLSCLRAGGGRISAHLGEPGGWRRSSSQPWPQHPMSRWLTRRFYPLKKVIIYIYIYIYIYINKCNYIYNTLTTHPINF
ncbi:hypothetical protein Hanom_Chr04g00378461 [Helianthus anomalus]